MAAANSIAPFPADVDRDSFGHWLSGFTDGEGHFSLALSVKKGVAFLQPQLAFRLGLRDDDGDALLLAARVQVQHRQRRYGNHGCAVKWTPAQREHFVFLVSAIKEQRTYSSHTVSIDVAENLPLFD